MISILIPIYNGIEFIEESVTSVLHQTFTEWELLIGVNGHLKNSDVYLKAKEYERKAITGKIKVSDFVEIKGKPNALNEMVKHAKYDSIALLDVDDVWLPEKLENQVQMINLNYDVIGTNCVYFGNVNKKSTIPLKELTYYNFKKGNPIINSSVIIKKELCYWNDVPLEDYDLWIRLRKQGRTFYNCPDVLMKHRLHSNSAFNAKGNGQFKKELIQKHFS
jgi:teichuronic acid biosynthesis glycosyltransferase TuaG